MAYTGELMMSNWMKTVYSDGSPYFVSNPTPQEGEVIKISIRLSVRSPIERIDFQARIFGTTLCTEMKKGKLLHGLQYYETSFLMNMHTLSYSFKLYSKNQIYYYTQKGITAYSQDEECAFRIVHGYHYKSWVAKSVFYEIFPDRFFRSERNIIREPRNYTYLDHKPFSVADWNQMPDQYYSSYCLDFYEGNLDGITEKIPYLKALGINAIYLTPIFFSPTTHKYDAIDYFTIDPWLGGDQAFCALCEQIHANNMRLILDIPLNHTSQESLWFNRNGSFFDKSIGAYNNFNSKERGYYYITPNNDYLGWNGLLQYPKLNYQNEDLQSIMFKSNNSILKKWIKPPYNIDGYRFDAANEVGNVSKPGFQKILWEDICSELRKENQELYLFGEEWFDANTYLRDGIWDGCMNYYGFARPIRQLVEHQDYTGFNKEIRPSQLYSVDSCISQIKQVYNKLPWVIQQSQYNLLDSHDLPRLHNCKNVCLEQRTAAILLQYMFPGTPCIYYGDELDISGHTEAPEGYRYPMPWEKNYENCFIFKLYQTLNKLKTSEQALWDGCCFFDSVGEECFLIIRFTEIEVLFCIVSLHNKGQEVEVELETLSDAGCSNVEMLFSLNSSISYITKDKLCCNIGGNGAILVKGYL